MGFHFIILIIIIIIAPHVPVEDFFAKKNSSKANFRPFRHHLPKKKDGNSPNSSLGQGTVNWAKYNVKLLGEKLCWFLCLLGLVLEGEHFNFLLLSISCLTDCGRESEKVSSISPYSPFSLPLYSTLENFSYWKPLRECVSFITVKRQVFSLILYWVCRDERRMVLPSPSSNNTVEKVPSNVYPFRKLLFPLGYFYGIILCFTDGFHAKVN